jgi:hypothetical protein
MRFKHMLSGIAAAAMLAVPIVQPGNSPLGATAVQAREANVSINVFFDALGEEGEWIDYPPYGYVWAPSDVPADWAPYTRGHWAYTERYGWTFVSDEPFAWAVYHYGRWGYDQDIGWFWVPGTVWAPAWVSWRRSDDVVGWAPLPPDDEGYAVSAEVSYAEPPRHYWHFVPAPEFLAPDLAVVIVHDEAPFDETEDVGPVIVRNNIVVNNRIDVHYVERVTRQQVQVTKVQVVTDPVRAERPAKRGAIVAVERSLAKPPKDAAPRKVVEAKAVKAPTKGQKVEATASAGPGKNVAKSGAGQTAAGAQPAVKAPGVKANGKAEEKTAKAVTGKDNQPTPPAVKEIKPPQKAANGEAGQQIGKAKRKHGQGAAQPVPAPSVTSAQAGQAQAKLVPAARKEAAGKLAQKKLKKQPGAVAQGQSAPNRNAVAKAAPKLERQAAAQAARQARPPAAAGPRKPKQVAQLPSREKTGAIARSKAPPKVRVPAPGPKVAGAKPHGKPKACKAALHAAGKC